MPVDNEYRKQVQEKVQDLLSERHEKLTLKLVVEAVVEGVKLYRSYKEEKAAEEKGKKSGRQKKKGNMGESREDEHRKHSENGKHRHGHESTGRRRHRRHRSRSRGEDRGRHHRSSRDERRSRSRHRYGDESCGKRHERSRSRDRRPRSRRRYEDDDVRDPVTENPPNNDSDYQVMGGIGPADTLHDGHRESNAPLPGDGNHPESGASGYQTSWRDLTLEGEKSPTSGRRAPIPYRSARRPSKERSRVRSHSRARKNTPRSGRKRSDTLHRPHRQKSRERSSSRRRDHPHDKQSNPRPGRIGASRSPTRQQKGPDGTPFGSLPEYKSKAGIALGFGDHFMNTYRHIKAEHDAGYRTRGMFEKALDEARTKRKTDAKGNSDKRKSGQTREREKIRKSEPERVRWAEGYPWKIKGNEWKLRAAQAEAWERQKQNSPVPEIRVPPSTSSGSPRRPLLPITRKVSMPNAPNCPSPPAPEPPSWQYVSLQRPPPILEEIYERQTSPSREPSVRGVNDRSKGGAAASYYGQAPRSPMPGGYEDHDEAERKDYHQPQADDEVPRPHTPTSLIIPPYPDMPPSPVESQGPSRSSSPIMLHAPRPASPPSRFTPAFLQNISMPALQHSAPTIPPPPSPPGSAAPSPGPPPAPPPPAVRLPNNGGMAALLGDIQGGFKLRKVADSDKRDRSNNPRADKVAYEQTAHSHDVEEHERAQARETNSHSPFRGNNAWSTVLSLSEEADVRPESNKAFQDDLARALQARAWGSGTCTPAIGPRRGSNDNSLIAGSRTSMIANVCRKLQDEGVLTDPWI